MTINANIGTSPTTSSLDEEVVKLRLAERWGTDTVMDLSTGKRIHETRAAVLAVSTVPIGTVPIYEAMDGLRQPRSGRSSGCRRSSSARRTRGSTT